MVDGGVRDDNFLYEFEISQEKFKTKTEIPIFLDLDLGSISEIFKILEIVQDGHV